MKNDKEKLKKSFIKKLSSGTVDFRSQQGQQLIPLNKIFRF